MAPVAIVATHILCWNSSFGTPSEEGVRSRNRRRRLLARCRAADASYNQIRFAGIAQSVEQLIRNQQVACSSHVSSSNPVRFPDGVLFVSGAVLHPEPLADQRADFLAQS